MFEQTNGLRLHQLTDHIAENCHHGEESFIRVANVRQASFVKKDLLNDKNGHGFGQFRASLHYAKAERYDFRGQEKMDHSIVVILLETISLVASRVMYGSPSPAHL